MLRPARFLNNQMLPIVQKIIEQSPTPPVTILMGDHGLLGDARMENFTAIYLPKTQNNPLYPSISEVNLFRAVFNSTFNAGYAILPDQSIQELSETQFRVVPETAAHCLP